MTADEVRLLTWEHNQLKREHDALRKEHEDLKDDVKKGMKDINERLDKVILILLTGLVTGSVFFAGVAVTLLTRAG